MLKSDVYVISPCVRVIDDLRLERRGYPLLFQVCPINAVEKMRSTNIGYESNSSFWHSK